MKTRNLLATLLAVALVLGGIPLATNLDLGSGLTGDDASDPVTDTEADDAAGTRAAGLDDGSPDTAEDPQPSQASDGTNPPHPLVGPSEPGATPLEMTARLLGPVPEDLRRVDPSLSLAEAMRRHPALADGAPVETPQVEAGPVTNALARLVQAHAVLTEVQTAAGNGDAIAKDLLPYAAAQLATQAQETAPVFDAASKLNALDAKSDLRLDGRGEPVAADEVADLQTEIDRLYEGIGLPSLPANAGDQDPTQLARIVHATADVVDVTRKAQRLATVAEGLNDDIRLVDEALSDGVLTSDEARLVTEVATTVHAVTITPLQTRLDALHTLEATVDEVVPTLGMPASHSPLPIHEVNQARNDTEDALSDAEEEARSTAENESEQARSEAEDRIEPVVEELRDNFVDPLGAIVILDEGDDHVNSTGSPVPVNVPGVGAVGSLFPRSPILVVDRGGDEVYTGLPRTRAASDTVERSPDPIVSEDDLPVDARQPIEDIPELGGLTADAIGAVKSFMLSAYGFTVHTVEDETSIRVAVTADTPAQIVVDLDGDDRYEGDKGAAHAAGGGTAAVFDRRGDDTYDVKRGIGLLAEDGLALVKDRAGDDTYRADRGIGSVLQPFTVDGNTLQFDDRFRFKLGGLGGLVDVEGNDTYEVGEIGIGFGVVQTDVPVHAAGVSASALPTTIPIALDLAGGAEGFGPQVPLVGFSPDPTAEVQEDHGGQAKLWLTQPSSNVFNTIIGPFIAVFGDGLPQIQTQAAWRDYGVDVEEASQGHLRVRDHNVTVEAGGFLSGFEQTVDPHTDVLVDLTGDADVYEPPYPLILVDGGSHNDTYRDASPLLRPTNATFGQSPGFGELLVNQPTTTMLVLDTSGDDVWTGETAHLNTTEILRKFDAGDASGFLTTASAVVVDAAGDDHYEGNVSSTLVNLTTPTTGPRRAPSAWTTLVHDGGGSDTIDAHTAGGIQAVHARAPPGILADATAHTATNLLLMGTEDPDTETNRFNATDSSFGAVRVVNQNNIARGGPPATITQLTRLIAGAAVAGPTQYHAANHSLGSIRWCEADEPCPRIETQRNLQAAGAEQPIIAGLFVGSSGPDTYTLNKPDGLGHVTIDKSQACTRDVPGTGLQTDLPAFVTRFVEVGGGDDYRMTHPRADLPPWRNDHSWRPFNCAGLQDIPLVNNLLHRTLNGGVEEALNTSVVQAGGTVHDAHTTVEDSETGETATVRQIDTLGVDNLGQYVLALGAQGLGDELERQTGLVQFEPPRLCLGHYAQRDDGATLRGLQRDACADRQDPARFEDPTTPLDTTKRVLLTTRTTGSVPGTAFGAVNPCDVGRSGDRFLELDVRDENRAPGNALAHNVSGCWATLQIRPVLSTNATDFVSDTEATGPVWEPHAPDGNGWANVLTSEVHCGYTDATDETRIRCATDAFPMPYHVDGTNGRNDGRWFLQEGVYDYRFTFHGPIAAILDTNSTLESQLRIDHDPLAETGPVPGFTSMPTRTPEGLLSWIGNHSQVLDTEAPGAMPGLKVQGVAQSGEGEPEAAQVVSPLRLDSHRTIFPLVCLDGVPFRGDPTDAESVWRRDVGVWVTTYEPLEEWTNDDEDVGAPLEDCAGSDGTGELDAHTSHTLTTDLIHKPLRGEAERIPLPDDAAVDVTSTIQRLTPETGPSYRATLTPDGPAWTGSTDGWENVTVDVSDLAGQTARFRFRLASNATDTAPGMYVDDVRVCYSDESARTCVFEDTLEGRTGEWQHFGPGDEFELGRPTTGPQAAASGVNAWGTDLDGHHEPVSDQTLITPTVDLMRVPNDADVTLEFALWLETAGPATGAVVESAEKTPLVDDNDPVVDVGPLQGPLGVDLEDHGLGVSDVVEPNFRDTLSIEDVGGEIRLELPIQALDESPIPHLTMAGEDDAPWEENVLASDASHLVFEDAQGNEITRPCGPADADACMVSVNLTHAGQGPKTSWHRNATLNVSIRPGFSDTLRQAIHRSIQDNEPLTLELPSGVEVADEAGNAFGENIDELIIDLKKPSDVALPCNAEGVSVVTSETTVPIMTFIGPEDVEGLFVERTVNRTEQPQVWIPREDLVRVDRFCNEDDDGQWLMFDYTAHDAESGTEVLHRLSTVTVDHAGNRERVDVPFEFSILFDGREPGLSVTQTAATPEEVTVTVTSEEEIRLSDDTALILPDGSHRAPLERSHKPSEVHTLTFAGLDANTTYPVVVDAIDRVDRTNATRLNVTTASTMDVIFHKPDPVAGDNVTVTWAAGALGPTEGGNPTARVKLEATQEGTTCASRGLTTFIDAPLHAPENHTMVLPVTECPRGELDLQLHVENGPEDAPVQTIDLQRTVLHDVDLPQPGIDVSAEANPSGWYTTPVSVTPTGDDDSSIESVRILTDQGPVSRLTLDTSGKHEVTVEAVDAAGRVSTETFRVPVDLSRPQVEVVSQDRLPTERSVITVRVLGSDDASGLSAIRTRQADGTFGAWTPVVEGMQLRVDISDLDALVAEVRDRAGHVTQTLLPVSSLADPPSVQAGSTEATDPGSIEVHAVLDRPLALEASAAQAGDTIARTVTEPAREHRFTLSGLTPASTADVLVKAQLSDGRSVRLDALSTSVQLPADEGPPTTPENLTAEILDDGTVRLTWDAAEDDAGIARYLVQRRVDGVVADQASLTKTRMLDDAEAGRAHSYRVKAIDLGGRTGAWTAPVTVTPELPFKILSYDITPEVATAGDPVSITVVAQGSHAPEDATLELGDRRVPLVLQDGGQGRWIYRANVTLPTTDTFFPQGVQIHMDGETFPTEGSFPGPVVKALEEGQVSTNNPVPAPSLVLVALTVGLVAVLRRKRWSA